MKVMRVRWVAALLVSASIAAACLPALADDISVSVNGAPIRSEAAPVMDGGRLLLPARAVFNALGAFVDFDPASKAVIIAQSKATIVLHLFSQRTTVNGNVVWLDVPAQDVNGRTLVPARFVSEVLGAHVAYNAALGRVAIDLPGVRPYGPTAGTSGAPLTIASLTLDTHGKTLLTSGDVVQVNMTGTPGAAATFDLAGIATGIAMHEIARGAYTGFYVVPSGRNVNDIHVYGHLRDGAFVADRESDAALTVVGLQPAIRDAYPQPGAHTYVMQPSIAGVIDTNGGPSVDPQTIRMYLDNSNVTQYAGISADRFYFTPYYPLAPGWHRVGVYGQDLSGIGFSSEWSFYEIPTYAYGSSYGAGFSPWQNLPIYNNGFNFNGFGYNGYPVISLTTTAYGVVGTGGSIPLMMIARSGGSAIGSIEGAPGAVVLAPVFGSPGYYVGNYIVPPGLNMRRVILMAQYYPPTGGLPLQIVQPTGVEIFSGLPRHRQRLVHVPAIPPWIAHVLPPTPPPGKGGGNGNGGGGNNGGNGKGSGGATPTPPPVEHIRVVQAPPTIAPLPVWHGRDDRGKGRNGNGGNGATAPLGSSATPTPAPVRTHTPDAGSGPFDAPTPKPTATPRPPPTQVPPTQPPGNGSSTPRPHKTPHPHPTPTPRPPPTATPTPRPTPTN